MKQRFQRVEISELSLVRGDCNFCFDNREEKNYGEDLTSNSVVYEEDWENWKDFTKVTNYDIIP